MQADESNGGRTKVGLLVLREHLLKARTNQLFDAVHLAFSDPSPMDLRKDVDWHYKELLFLHFLMIL